MAYDAPSIKSVGSVADLTLALRGRGNDDKISFFGFTLTFGDNPSVS